MSQDTSICLTTPDEVLPGVIGLLPPGNAWEAASIPGTTHNKFWRAIATTVAQINSRLCAYVDELYCSTAKESTDQWRAEYAFDPNDGCNPYPSLCAKVAAYGGQTKDYYIQVAKGLGWEITIDDSMAVQDTLPIAGCVQAGCMRLGPPIELVGDCFMACDYGRAVDYPDKQMFDVNADRSTAVCQVPGSTLGTAGCCMMAGEFVLTDPIETENANACTDLSVYKYSKPRPATTARTSACLTDDTGYFKAYVGYAHNWTVTIDIKASTNLQKNLPQFQSLKLSMAGCVQAGCFSPQPWTFNPALCFLEAIKPAHTTITYKLVNA